MHGRQIALTEQQEERLRALAVARGTSEPELIRGILDASLGPESAEGDASIALASTFGVLADHPDWPERLQSIRPGRDRSTHDGERRRTP